MAVAVGVGEGVPVEVAVAVGVGEGVGVIPPQQMKVEVLIEMVSTRHPVPVTLLSEAMRKRSLMVCPLTFGPRFATVLM